MLRLEATEFQVFIQKKKTLKYIKLFVVVASVIEAILSSASISLIDFMANGFKNSNEYLNISKGSFCLIISSLNGFATFFSLSVDLIMYPMFIRVFIYFFKQYKKRNDEILRP